MTRDCKVISEYSVIQLFTYFSSTPNTINISHAIQVHPVTHHYTRALWKEEDSAGRPDA